MISENDLAKCLFNIDEFNLKTGEWEKRRGEIAKI
jgi:hypothetical protein